MCYFPVPSLNEFKKAEAAKKNSIYINLKMTISNAYFILSAIQLRTIDIAFIIFQNTVIFANKVQSSKYRSHEYSRVCDITNFPYMDIN